MTTDQISPPVVAVVVVHDPGEWFDDTLASLAAQDYATLRTLFLINGGAPAIDERISATLPDAVIRRVDAAAGFGPTANAVLDIVEGGNGFFCFLHDDVALERNTIRLLVEELYRSNAGAVGPKLVEWHNPRILQSVGLGVDAFGEVDTFIEAGEYDQEQHDAVSDVFALPSACLLIRADLFRTIGGFSPSIDFHGEDVELCWRAHLSGARTVVTPAARVRHRSRLADRRPDLDHTLLAERHRVATVATLTGARRLPLVGLRMLTLTLGQLVSGIFTGGAGRALQALRSMVGLLPRLGSIAARRRSVQSLRLIPDDEVLGLQMRGSARLTSYLRSRGTIPVDPEASVERRWRQTAGSAPAITWIALVVAFVVGSRQMISGAVPTIGQFLQFPSSPGEMFSSYTSGWWNHGFGSSEPQPTGLGLISVGSTAALWHMGLWRTVAIIGWIPVGWLGMWRLARMFPTARSRITAVVVYAALPLPVALMATGRWAGLVCYGSLPWVVHLLRRTVGIETVGQAGSRAEERYADHDGRLRLRLAASLVLAVAVPMAFTPAFAVVVVGVGVVLAATSLLMGVPWMRALALFGSAAGAVVGAMLLHLPWSSTWFGDGGWTAIIGVPRSGGTGLGLGRLAHFELAGTPLSAWAVLLYIPVVGALLVARGWRLTWAARSASLVAVFLGVALLADRGSLGLRPPEAAVLLVPVALGLALSAACFSAALADDVLIGGFGWRQPLGVLCSAAILIGIIPGIVGVAGGRWSTPRSTLATVVDQLPVNPPEGNYRVLWLGDPQVMPVGAWMYRPGIAYAVSNDGPLTINDGWPGTPTVAERSVREALTAIADGLTLRAGRLLAVYGIRYLIIPVEDGAHLDRKVPVPGGLLDALDDQLDLSKPLLGPLSYLVYENAAWLPTSSQLTPTAAEAVIADDARRVAAADLSGAVPWGTGQRLETTISAPATAGTIHIASPLSDDWSMSVGGKAVAAQPGFGSTTSFAVPTDGVATLAYDRPWSRLAAVVLQIIAWLAVALAATRVDPRRWYRRRRAARPVIPEPALAMTSADVDLPPWTPGQALDDVWGDDPGTDGEW